MCSALFATITGPCVRARYCGAECAFVKRVFMARVSSLARARWWVGGYQYVAGKSVWLVEFAVPSSNIQFAAENSLINVI